MWTREQIKGNAKYVLSFSYWKAFLACLIVSLVAGVSNMGGSSTGYTMTYQISSDHFSWRIGGIYLNVVKIMFLRDLYTFLWSLLLIIPVVDDTFAFDSTFFQAVKGGGVVFIVHNIQVGVVGFEYFFGLSFIQLFQLFHK